MAATAGEIVGVALPECEAVERQAKRIGGDLRVSCLVALAVGMRPDLEIDAAVLADAQFSHLVGLAARGFQEAGEPESAQPASFARIPLPCLEAFGRFARQIDRTAKAALLDRKPHCGTMRKTADNVLAPQPHGIHPELAGGDINQAFDQV